MAHAKKENSPETKRPKFENKAELQEMGFRLISQVRRARHGVLKLSHSDVETPVFMPVG
jgi:hypothetical protein